MHAPWTARKTRSDGKFGATATAIVGTTSSALASTSERLRPRRSENDPHAHALAASASTVTVRVKPASAGETSNVRPSSGRIACVEYIVTNIPPLLLSTPRGAGPIDPTEPLELHEEELAHARAFLEQRGLEAEYVAAVGEPADTIVHVAEERNADLIVVGTREPNVLQRI